MEEDTSKRKVQISTPDQILEVENKILQEILAVETQEAVEAALCFAGYLGNFGLDADNYPLFLRLLDIDNHWVTDALLGTMDPVTFFDPIPSNRYLLERALWILAKRPPGGVYEKTLAVLLGVLKKAYSDPRDGYTIHPMGLKDVDNLGKHLDKSGGQDDPTNRLILEILENLSELEGVRQDHLMEGVARQAGKIRMTFFDNRKALDSAIPESLMIRGNYRATEVHPRKLYVN